MARLTWLPDVLRDAGLAVRTVDGWSRRGKNTMDPRVVVCHHTAANPTPDRPFPSERILVHGREGLPGPLSQLGLDLNGMWVVIAAGKANHAGRFGKRTDEIRQGASKNAHCIGIEAENNGLGAAWPGAQIDSYIQGCAALCRHLGWGSERVIAHKEWAPRRKIDPNFSDPPLSMDDFRDRVAAELSGPAHSTGLFRAVDAPDGSGTDHLDSGSAANNEMGDTVRRHAGLSAVAEAYEFWRGDLPNDARRPGNQNAAWYWRNEVELAVRADSRRIGTPALDRVIANLNGTLEAERAKRDPRYRDTLGMPPGPALPT